MISMLDPCALRRISPSRLCNIAVRQQRDGPIAARHWLFRRAHEGLLGRLFSICSTGSLRELPRRLMARRLWSEAQGRQQQPQQQQQQQEKAKTKLGRSDAEGLADRDMQSIEITRPHKRQHVENKERQGAAKGGGGKPKKPKPKDRRLRPRGEGARRAPLPYTGTVRWAYLLFNLIC